ncbi:MAG: DUF1566 domain-containing protein [Pseudomonadota bacterium]
MMTRLIRCFVFIMLLFSPVLVQAACDHLVVDTSRGIVRDLQTNLTWSRCLSGQVSPTCFGIGAAMAWVDALNQARAAKVGSIENWRLPKIDELQAMARSACVSAVFPGLQGSVLWSASANIDYATDAWAYDFDRQQRIVKSRDSGQQVWLVSNAR